MEDIGIFIEYEGTVIQFPVNPDRIPVKRAGTNSTTEIILLGEINLLRDARLREISWSCFFPYLDWYPGIRTKGEFQSAAFYIEFLNTIINDKKPCRLIVTGINISMKVSIESFDYEHKAGDHEDTYYTITLKEYKDYQIIKTSTTADRANTSPLSTAPNTSTESALNKPVLPSEVTIGCNVVLNGRVHVDSYGNGAGKTFQNYRGIVNLINKRGTHPYHVTTPEGGWLGWVTEGSVKLA